MLIKESPDEFSKPGNTLSLQEREEKAKRIVYSLCYAEMFERWQDNHRGRRR